MSLTLCDFEAERGVIGAITLDQNAASDALTLGLAARDFGDPRNARIFEAVHALFEAGSVIDFVTISAELEGRGVLEVAGGKEYLWNVSEATPTTSRLSQHAKVVKHYSQLRELRSAATKITEMAENAPPASSNGAREAIERSIALLFTIASSESLSRLRHVKELIEEVLTEARQPASAASSAIQSGFTDLDSVLGGIPKGSLSILAARTSMGKSSLALAIAANAAIEQRKRVVFLSLEMSGKEIVNRLLCSRAGVDSQAIRLGKLSDVGLALIEGSQEQFKSVDLWIDASCSHSVISVRSALQWLRAKVGPPDLLVVDYLQLLQMPRAETRALAVGLATRALKAIAQDYNLAILACAQLNRNSEQERRKPRLSDLRESGAIEQDADMVLLLHRELDPTSAAHRLASLEIAKQRNGPTATITLSFDPEATRFRSIS